MRQITPANDRAAGCSISNTVVSILKAVSTRRRIRPTQRRSALDQGFGPGLPTVLARWRDNLDVVPLVQDWRSGRVVKSAVAQHQQVMRLLEHRSHGCAVMKGGWRQQPVVNDLPKRGRDMQP